MHVIWSIKIIHESCGFIMGVSRPSIVVIIMPKRVFLSLFFFVPKKSKTFLQENIICTLTAANSFYYLIFTHHKPRLLSIMHRI